MSRLLAALLLSSGAFAQSVVISQVYGGGGNTGATLRNDFIELFNATTEVVNLDGWSVQYTTANGESWQVTPLSGTIQPGRYFLVQQAAGAGGTSDLPRPDATGTIPVGSTAGKVALARVVTPLSGARPSDGVMDLVGYGAANGFEGSGPTPALTNTTALLRRRNGCTDTNDNTADFQIGSPSPRNSSAAGVDCSAPPPVAEELRISQVQGSGDESPYAGRLVKVRGVVTARRSNGFWIQSETSAQDNDPATSEGVFVFGSNFGTAAPGRGDLVEVTGTVTEFRPNADLGSPPLTELIEPTFAQLGTADMPAAVELPAGGDWERFEGMRVFATLTTVSGSLGSFNEVTGTGTSNGVFFGVHAGTARPFRDPSGVEDPRLVRVDTNALGARTLDVTTGMQARATGPLDYAFRTYSITAEPGVLIFDEPLRATALPPALATEFRLASMNLERLFDRLDDPSTQDPIVSAEAVQRRLDKAARVIRDVLGSPEIIGVQEAENLEILQALGTAAGDYEARLIEGNDIGGIDVGLLVKRSRVQITDVIQEGKDVRQVDNSILNDRPPIAARLRVDNYPLTLIVVHQRSLIDVGSPNVDRKRRGQAEFLRDLIRRRIEGGEPVVALGDYNMFQFDPLMDLIKSAGSLTNLTDTLALSESYSYVQNGMAQTLDHIVVSPELRSRFTRLQYARVNADYPESYRNEPIERSSDHDIPVAYFSLDPANLRVTAAGVTNAATNLSSPVSPSQIITIYGRGIGPESPARLTSGLPPGVLGGTRVLFDGVEARIFYAQANQVNAIVPPALVPGRTTTLSVEFQGQAVGSAALKVLQAEPGIFTIDGSGRGQGAVLNQDLSVKSAATPAARGSVVAIYGTGGSTLPEAHVRIGGKDAEVSYA
ncbi:MAG TPA: lamin tail domain-containing protein, partial [Bryobacteraceae bacterium]|nr:lamin tail domain-containing protein [Bryobacteraceae bacterium]